MSPTICREISESGMYGLVWPKYFKFSEGEEQTGEGCANLRREGTQTILVLNFEGCQLLDIGRATSDI